jgi:hypothetical protein
MPPLCGPVPNPIYRLGALSCAVNPGAGERSPPEPLPWWVLVLPPHPFAAPLPPSFAPTLCPRPLPRPVAHPCRRPCHWCHQHFFAKRILSAPRLPNGGGPVGRHMEACSGAPRRSAAWFSSACETAPPSCTQRGAGNALHRQRSTYGNEPASAAKHHRRRAIIGSGAASAPDALIALHRDRWHRSRCSRERTLRRRRCANEGNVAAEVSSVMRRCGDDAASLSKGFERDGYPRHRGIRHRRVRLRKASPRLQANAVLGSYGSINPQPIALTTACIVLTQSSFHLMLFRWNFTVSLLISRIKAVSTFVLPCLIQLRISISRSVRRTSCSVSRLV